MSVVSPIVCPPRDWTLPVAEAIHAILDRRQRLPQSSWPWCFQFHRDGRVEVTARARPQDRPLLISEPGTYSQVWGPMMVKLARYLWEYVAEDVRSALGGSIEVPSAEQMQQMYWGPMPAPGPDTGSWEERRTRPCLPQRSREALQARERYTEQLRDNSADFEVVDGVSWLAPARRPREEALSARAAAVEPAAEPTQTAQIEPAQSWRFGRWGKGFRSASGAFYTWNTSSPREGGHPQHKQVQSLIAAHEGQSVLEAGHQLTDSDQVGYLAPVVIAPDGTYSAQSADPFWSDNPHMPDITARAQTLRQRWGVEGFANCAPALCYEPDNERFNALKLGGGYGHGPSL